MVKWLIKGRPLRKMFSYTYSTTLVFTNFEVRFKNLELRPVKHAQTELDSARCAAPRRTSAPRRAHARCVASRRLGVCPLHAGSRLSRASRDHACPEVCTPSRFKGRAFACVAPLRAHAGSWPCRPPAEPTVPRCRTPLFLSV
jgi:hypothetical protein